MHIMGAKVFKQFQTFIHERSGILLGEGKEALVTARISKRVHLLGLQNPLNYLAYIKADATGKELVQFLNCITTNFTNFFRDVHHFEYLSTWVNQQINNGQTDFRIWSAACSTGEEPYSLAINMFETIDGRNVDFKLLATDLSTQVLKSAKAGVYSVETLGPVSKTQQGRYCTPCTSNNQSDEEGQTFAMRSFVKEKILFRRINLAKPPFPMKGPFDVVFCCNVMIYFDKAVRQGLVANIERLIRPGGLLVTGHSETLPGVSDQMDVIASSIHQKKKLPPTCLSTHELEQKQGAL